MSTLLRNPEPRHRAVPRILPVPAPFAPTLRPSQKLVYIAVEVVGGFAEGVVSDAGVDLENRAGDAFGEELAATDRDERIGITMGDEGWRADLAQPIADIVRIADRGEVAGVAFARDLVRC